MDNIARCRSSEYVVAEKYGAKSRTKINWRKEMITLCEKCFPNYGCHEIKTMVPISPCNQCGRFDDREHGGLRCHLFSSDPRISENNCIISEQDDQEAGIYGGVWEITGGFIFDDSEQRELFRAGIFDAFQTVTAGKLKVYFTDEIPNEPICDGRR